MTFEEFQEYIKNETPAENCPVSKTLELFAGKWTSRVIYRKSRPAAVWSAEKEIRRDNQYNAFRHFKSFGRKGNRTEKTIQRGAASGRVFPDRGR